MEPLGSSPGKINRPGIQVIDKFLQYFRHGQKHRSQYAYKQIPVDWTDDDGDIGFFALSDMPDHKHDNK